MVLATHSIRQFPLHFPSRAAPCAITFQTQSSKLFLAPTDEIPLYSQHRPSAPHQIRPLQRISSLGLPSIRGEYD